MRILVVTQYFWPEDFRINDVVDQLVARGHDVTVLTGLPNYPSGQFQEGYGPLGPFAEDRNGANIIRVPLSPRRRGKGVSLALNYFTFAVTASFRALAFSKRAHDVVLVYEPSPVTVGVPGRIASWRIAAPMLFWVQDLWPETLSATNAVSSRYVLRLIDLLVRWIYRGCSRVLVQSRAFIPHVENQGVASEKIGYLPNSAEEFYAPRSRTEAWDGPDLPDGFRVMFTGNVGSAQSFETIVAAARLLREYQSIHWLIVGDGRQIDWLRAEIQRLGLSSCIHLYGRQPVAAMPAWFAQADVMLASLRRDPTFAMTIPAKLQSYMACAKPIVASLDGEGARVIREARAGFVAAASDPDGLAQAVLDLYRMPIEERTAMGANGLTYFQGEFGRSVLLDRLERWFIEAVGEV